jgi:methyl-accepting chemotaxis protein
MDVNSHLEIHPSIGFIRSIKLAIVSLNISLRTKFLILTAITFIGFGIIFYFGTLLVQDVKIGSNRYAKIKDYHLALVKIEALKSDFNQIRVEYLTLAEESNPEFQKQRLSVIYSLNSRVNLDFRDILNAIPKEHQKPFVDARDEWQVFTDNMSGKIIPVILAGNKELALERIQSIQKYRYERVSTGLKTVSVILGDLAKNLEHSTENYIATRITTIIISSSLIAVVILIMALLITSLIIRPLSRAVTFAQEVSLGNLSKQLNETINDEVGTLAVNLNTMVFGLGQLVGKIRSVSSKLSEVSQTVSITSQQVSNEAHSQSISITQSSSAINEISQATQNILDDVINLSISNCSTNSSVEEMAINISDIAGFSERLTNLTGDVCNSITSINNSIVTLDKSIENLNDKALETSVSISIMDNSALEIQQNSHTTALLAEQARIYATSGQKSVNATISNMNEIRTSSKLTIDVITDLSASAEDIGVILSVIYDINDRISLLALNAQIISAQAGDSGKAFGVVASEFKSLSMQTAQSTFEIVDKIERVQNQTKRAVEAINKTESLISQGERLSYLSGEALTKIVATVHQTSQETDAIALSIEKQRSGSAQITEAIKIVSSIANHIARASHDLKQESMYILENSEQITSMTASVSNAMKENASAAKHISRDSDKITLMIEQIKTNCEAEMLEIYRILKAMEEINAALTSNLVSAQTANQASDFLIHQVEYLVSAVDQFKLVKK